MYIVLFTAGAVHCIIGPKRTIGLRKKFKKIYIHARIPPRIIKYFLFLLLNIDYNNCYFQII
jgi:hypothetical protein